MKKEIKLKNLVTKCEVVDKIKKLPAIDILYVIEKSIKEIELLNDDASCNFAICNILRNIEEIKTYF